MFKLSALALALTLAFASPQEVIASEVIVDGKVCQLDDAYILANWDSLKQADSTLASLADAYNAAGDELRQATYERDLTAETLRHASVLYQEQLALAPTDAALWYATNGVWQWRWQGSAGNLDNDGNTTNDWLTQDKVHAYVLPVVTMWVQRETERILRVLRETQVAPNTQGACGIAFYCPPQYPTFESGVVGIAAYGRYAPLPPDYRDEVLYGAVSKTLRANILAQLLQQTKGTQWDTNYYREVMGRALLNAGILVTPLVLDEDRSTLINAVGQSTTSKFNFSYGTTTVQIPALDGFSASLSFYVDYGVWLDAGEVTAAVLEQQRQFRAASDGLTAAQAADTAAETRLNTAISEDTRTGNALDEYLQRKFAVCGSEPPPVVEEPPAPPAEETPPVTTTPPPPTAGEAPPTGSGVIEIAPDAKPVDADGNVIETPSTDTSTDTGSSGPAIAPPAQQVDETGAVVTPEPSTPPASPVVAPPAQRADETGVTGGTNYSTLTPDEEQRRQDLESTFGRTPPTVSPKPIRHEAQAAAAALGDAQKELVVQGRVGQAAGPGQGSR